MKIVAGGKTFTVPDGSTPEQISEVVDDYFARNQQQDDPTQLGIWRGDIPPADPNAQPAPAEGMDYASGLAGQSVQGTTASWGDEILSAAVAGLVHAGDAVGMENIPFTDTPLNIEKDESVMGTYRRIRDDMRARNESFRQDYPKASLAANVVGGALPLTKGLEAASAGAEGVAIATGIGAGWGMADYLGELQKYSDFEVLQAAKRAGLGALIPAGLTGGRGAWHWLKNREKDEVAAILKELQTLTHKTPQQIQAQAQRMGPDASLVDATGAVGVGYGQAARGIGAMDVAATMEKNIWPKLAQAKDKIRGTLQRITGKGQDEYHDTLTGLQTARKTRANELYGKALDEGVVRPTDKMVAIMNQNPSVRDAYQRVADKWAREGRQIPEVFNIDPGTGKVLKAWRGGKDVTQTVPNMRFLQEMKFEMDRMTGAMGGGLDSAGKVQFGRLMDDKREFLDEIYKQNPAFKKANEVFAGDIALESAVKMGRKHGLGRGNVDDQLEFIKGLNKSEKSAYLQGLMSDVYNTLGRAGEGVRGEELLGNLNSMTSQNAKKVLRALLGEEKTKQLMRTIQTQKRFKEVDTKLMQGSETAPRQAATESMAKRNQEFNIEDLKNMSITNRTLDRALKLLPNKYGKLGPEQLNELVDLMTKPNGVPAAIQRMKQAGFNQFEISEFLKVMTATGIALPPAVGPQQAQPTPVAPMPQQPAGLWQ